MERQDQNEAFIRRGYALWNEINRHRLDHPDDRVSLDSSTLGENSMKIKNRGQFTLGETNIG